MPASNAWTPKTRCSSSTPPAPPASPRACCTPRAATCCYAAMTHKYVFDYHEGDIFWCTADVGWITGHSYIVYGPLANGAMSLVFEGVPTYPDAARFWQVCDKHKVNTFYTAPTALRALMRDGRRAGQKDLAREPAPARHGRRANQSRSMGVVLPHGWRRALPDRRYLVADRNRRSHDHAAAGRNPSEAGFGHPAILRRAARHRRQPRARSWKARPRATWS